MRLFKNFLEPKIDLETLDALQYKLPEQIDVKIQKTDDGWFVASVKNLPGCVTQAKSFEELITMINDAVYCYLDIPEEYIPYFGIRKYMPSRKVLEDFKVVIPKQELELKFA